MHQFASAAAATLATLTFGTASLRADQNVSVQFNMPVHATVNVDETGCDNSPGPQITLEGEIALGGLQVQLLFENNVKGTHQTVVTFATNVVLVPLGQSIVIPKQPVLGGVGGNPYIWLQFYDNKGSNLTDPIFLGRCVQGLTLNQDLLSPALAGTLIAASDCSNNPGPTITFDGNMTLSGLNARFIFSNNVKGTHTAQATASVTILPDGTSVQIPKQPVDGGSGGNPLIYIQFLQGDGTPIGKSIFLGRCVQM
jgi:hypothetical protein